MNLLFFGSPPVAVPFLEACARASGCALRAVITQPDKPAGRGLELSPPAVKAAALRLGLPVLQPQKPSAIVPELGAFAPELAVVVAYGRFLKPDLLAAPRLGCLNVHFSLLPRHRGAAPVQWALLRGDARTGVTLFWITEGMDCGPIQRQAELAVGPDEGAPELFARLIELGVAELRAALAELAQGRVRREPQRGEPTLAPKLDAALAALDFSLPAAELHNRVRGLRAGPKAFLRLRLPGARAARVAVLRTRRAPPEPAAAGASPGTILRVERDSGVLVECAPGRLWLAELQPEGKRPQNAADFLNGLRLGAGDRLETWREARPQ